MFPELIRIGPVTITAYGVALLLAFVIGGLYVRRAFARAGEYPGSVYPLLLAALFGGIVGARAFYVAANWSQFSGALWTIFVFPLGGMVFQGGAIGGALAVWATVRYLGLPAPMVMDAAAPALSLGAAVGRLGCLANGCCVGGATSGPFGVRFAGYATPRVPIQLVDMAYNLAIFGLMAWMAGRSHREGGGLSRRARGGLSHLEEGGLPHREGDLLWLWFVLYGAGRFIVEFWRAVPAGAVPGSEAALGLNPIVLVGLTSPQLIAVAMMAVGSAMLARGRVWARAAGEAA